MMVDWDREEVQTLLNPGILTLEMSYPCTYECKLSRKFTELFPLPGMLCPEVEESLDLGTIKK